MSLRAHPLIWLREGQAWMTQARHLGRDWGVVREEGTGPVVVLLHGVYAGPGVFRPLRARLHAELDATTVTLGHVTGVGVAELARRLARLLEAEDTERPIHLIGHSLGGLVVRHYVDQGALHPRLVSTASLAAPFRGSSRAAWVPGQAARDLALAAPLLARLAQGTEGGRRVPHLSIAAADDLLVQRPGFPEFGEQVELAGVGHNGLLFDERVATLLVGWIRDGAIEQDAAGNGP
ncbi:MAG TPA: alpha/beta fold hydrolase [Polyangiaceae bacterium]|nr:alpha/beta fold hydrolase [Polyangiaceae bacterium]